MDALAVITTVYALAQGINKWLEERAEKEATIRQISTTITQIQHILQPLHDDRQAIVVEPQTLGIVKSIGSVLKSTQEHLVVWQDRRSRRILATLSPSSVIKQLKEDERQLGQQLVILLTSIAVTGFVEKRQKRRPVVLDNAAKPVAQQSMVLSPISNREVKEFWSGYVGAELPFISGDEFCGRLGAWMGETLDSSIRKGLLLRLDEFSIGGVTPAALQSWVGTGSLRGVVRMFAEDSNALSAPDFPLQTRKWWSTKPRAPRVALPLLVWIDDNPHNNSAEIESAIGMGIHVIQLASTALAKAWIESNSDFLRCNDHPSKVRFISDHNRDEYSTRHLNLSAGENILRYLRGRRYNIPVLIYTGYSVKQTTYVRDHHHAGSTSSFYVTMEFITALAEKSDDSDWVGFNTMGF